MQSDSRRLVRRATGIVVLVGLCTVILAVVGKRHFANAIKMHVDELLSDVEQHTDRRYTKDDVADLPAPARRYFETVLTEGQPHVKMVRLRQRGEFRLGGADAPWRPLAATQHFTTQPPGFVWDATIGVLPLLPARVIDLYRCGEGLLRARLLGVVPVASAGPDPEMNEGELVRYLGEAVWFPTALLPDAGIEWEAIDDHSARATLEHGDATASLVFHFDDRDQVDRVTTERYRQEEDSYAPWTGYFRNYEDRNGVRIPTEAEVEWNLPESDLSYWRATIEETEYRTTTPP